MRVAADVSHLTHQTGVGAALIHELQLLHPALLPADRALPAELFSRPWVAMPFKDGPRSPSKIVKAFVSQEDEKALLEKLEQSDPVEFAVLRDWMR